MKKRIIGIILAVLTVLAFLTACGGKKAECDFCGETKKCTTKTVWGESITVCNDCLDELSDF